VAGVRKAFNEGTREIAGDGAASAEGYGGLRTTELREGNRRRWVCWLTTLRRVVSDAPPAGAGILSELRTIWFKQQPVARNVGGWHVWDMPNAPENVLLIGEYGSDRRTIKMTRLTHLRRWQSQKYSIGLPPLKASIPQKDDTGFIAGFIAFKDAKLVMPPKWLQQNKIVKLRA
jgi:hypothetical protein